jgi:porin
MDDSLNQSITAAYIHADQKITENSGRGIGAFLQAGFSPSQSSINKTYLGLGVNLFGYLSKSKSDVLGLAIAYGNYNEKMGCETTLELTWQKQLRHNIYIQPDIQFIIHPSGIKSNLGNCLAGIVRVGLTF